MSQLVGSHNRAHLEGIYRDFSSNSYRRNPYLPSRSIISAGHRPPAHLLHFYYQILLPFLPAHLLHRLQLGIYTVTLFRPLFMGISS